MALISDDTLISICPTYGKAKVGWIFPDGSVVQTEFHGHRDALPVEYRERYDELLEQYNRDMDEDLESLEPGEHPALHRFDPEGDSNRQLLRELAEKGYMRFGLWVTDSGGKTVNLDLDGSPKGVRDQHDLIAMIVAGLNIENVYLADATQYGYKRKRQKQFG